MKILLITLPREGETKDFTTPEYLLTDFSHHPPLGLLAIAAGVDKVKHELKVLDTAVKRMNIEDCVKFITAYKPDVLGISVVTRRLFACRTIAEEVKKQNLQIKIIVGGPHLNRYPMETMKWGMIDFALTGFCEKTFPQFIETLVADVSFSVIPNLYYKNPSGEIVVNPPGVKPLILDDFPFPDRSLIDLDDYRTALDKDRMTAMYSSRGCPFRCIFCDVQEKAFHYRSAKKIVEEFEEIAKLGIKEIYIFDDSFAVLRERVIEMCNEIIKRGIKIKWSSRARVYPFDREMAALMKQAGCIRLHVGVESLDQDTLQFIKKGITVEQIENFFSICRELKIETLAYFITGFPNETALHRGTFLEKVRKLNPTYAYFNILCPLPKTEYYEMLLKDGTFKNDFWDEFARNPVKDFQIPFPRTKELQEELTKTVDKWMYGYYFRPKFIFEEIKRSSISPKIFWLKASGTLKLLQRVIKS